MITDGLKVIIDTYRLRPFVIVKRLIKSKGSYHLILPKGWVDEYLKETEDKYVEIILAGEPFLIVHPYFGHPDLIDDMGPHLISEEDRAKIKAEKEKTSNGFWIKVKEKDGRITWEMRKEEDNAR